MSTGNGLVKCYYDLQKSQRGMTLCMIKPVKRKNTAQFFSTQQIINRKSSRVNDYVVFEFIY